MADLFDITVARALAGTEGGGGSSDGLSLANVTFNPINSGNGIIREMFAVFTLGADRALFYVNDEPSPSTEQITIQVVCIDGESQFALTSISGTQISVSGDCVYDSETGYITVTGDCTITTELENPK